MNQEEGIEQDWDPSLSRIPRFAGVSPPLMKRIIPWLRRKSYKAGETFIKEGDPPEWLIFVEAGRAKVFRKVAEEREIIFGIFGPGETLGEVAMLEQIPYPASIQALDPLRCLFLPASFYLSLLNSDPEFAIATIRDLSMRVFYLIRRIHGNAGHAEFRSSVFSMYLLCGKGVGLSVPPCSYPSHSRARILLISQVQG